MNIKCIILVICFLIVGCGEKNMDTQECGIETNKDFGNFKYQETNGIPMCPYCKKPTKRTGGMGTTTLAYYPPVYDVDGKNTNPDRNINTSSWKCYSCGKSYSISGNYIDGYGYRGYE